jgi:flagellar hook assembly protein FlgD
MPNPFNPATAIGFDVAADARVTLRIFNASGRLARTLVSVEGLPAGRYRARWDGRDDAGREAASGVYFARLIVAGGTPFTATRRMLLLR